MKENRLTAHSAVSLFFRQSCHLNETKSKGSEHGVSYNKRDILKLLKTKEEVQ